MYAIDFEKNAVHRPTTKDEKAVILATALSCDIDYFSRHSGSGGVMGYMPFMMGGGSSGDNSNVPAVPDSAGSGPVIIPGVGDFGSSAPSPSAPSPPSEVIPDNTEEADSPFLSDDSAEGGSSWGEMFQDFLDDD